jgi:small-conductance mechanosensitive channel
MNFVFYVLSFLIIRMILNIVKNYISKSGNSSGELELHEISKKIFIIDITFYSLFFIILLFLLGINKTNLFIFFGSTGFIIAYITDIYIKNLSSYILIYFSNKIQIGDYLELDSKNKGFIKKIEYMDTLIISENNERIFIPNRLIHLQDIQVCKITDIIVSNIKFTIKYNSNYKNIKKEIEKMLEIILVLKNIKIIQTQLYTKKLKMKWKQALIIIHF